MNIEKLNDHFSYLILCIYCFVGLLASMFYFMKLFTETDKSFNFDMAIILGVTSVIAGIYIKIVGDMASNKIINRYIDSVPDDRKDMARRMF